MTIAHLQSGDEPVVGPLYLAASVGAVGGWQQGEPQEPSASIFSLWGASVRRLCSHLIPLPSSLGFCLQALPNRTFLGHEDGLAQPADPLPPSCWTQSSHEMAEAWIL